MRHAVLLGVIVLGLRATTVAHGQDSPSNPATGAGAVSDAQVRSFLAYCSRQADARGLDVRAGYAEARKMFRRDCMHELGVDPVQR